MNMLPSPPAPSAEMPLLGDFRHTCAQLLQQKRSYLAIFLAAFPLLREELKQEQTQEKRDLFGKIIAAKWDIGDPIGLLFHAIPRRLLESLVLRTVAFDDFRKPSWFLGRRSTFGHGYKYDLQDAGVYVVSISIEKRNGKFLSGNELGTLSRDIYEYIDCYDKVAKAESRGLAPEPDAVATIKSVDTQFGDAADHGLAKFIHSPSGRDSMEKLAKSLQRAHNAAINHDPTGNTIMIQSPCYVGCSENLKNRREAYFPSKCNKSTLTRVSKPYGLTLCLLNKRGLKPEPHFLTVIRTWKPEQIQVGEQLVSLLAGSYVSQFGFNVQLAGQSVERRRNLLQMQASEAYVLSCESHLRDNLDLSEKEGAELAALEEHMADIAKLTERNLEAELQQALQVAVDPAELEENLAAARAELEENLHVAAERQPALELWARLAAKTRAVMDGILAMFDKYVPGDLLPYDHAE